MDYLLEYDLYDINLKKKSIYSILNSKNIIALYFVPINNNLEINKINNININDNFQYYSERLIQIYDLINNKFNNLEIIFIPINKNNNIINKNDFLNLYFSMPWYALPYYKKDIINNLIIKFNISYNKPSLLFFNKHGNLINQNGFKLIDQYFYNTDQLYFYLNK